MAENTPEMLEQHETENAEPVKKKKRESKAAFVFSALILLLFIGVCFFIYKSLISQGYFLELKLGDDKQPNAGTIQVVSQGEAISYNTDVGMVVTQACSNDDEIVVYLSVNCAGKDIYIFSPVQIALRSTDADTHEDTYASPQETNKFAFLEKQTRKFSLNFPLKYVDTDNYTLIIYDEYAEVVGNIALEVNK